MDYDLNSYAALSLIYDVAYDLSQSLERDCIHNDLKDDQIAVLAGSYAVIDWVTNRIAELGLEGDECEPYHAPTVQNLIDAPMLMNALANTLTQNLFSTRCPGTVDYRIVQALAGLRAIVPYIESITRILGD